MAKAGFYAVAKGRVPGIYATWEDCEPHVKGYTDAKYKKFKTLREAEQFVGISSSTSTALVPFTSRRSFLPVPASVSRASGMSQFQSRDRLRKNGRAKGDVSLVTDNVNEEGCDVVYADGACKGNGQAGSVAGIGVWWGHGDPRNIAERCPGGQTNNRAELIAIVRVLETTPMVRPLIIKTDSTYSIKCLRVWHQGWEHRGWKTLSGKPVLNAPLIKYLLSLIRLREERGFPVRFVYVKGHAGIEGNEGADRQANLGVMLPEVPERDWKEERRRIGEDGDEEGTLIWDKGVQVDMEEFEQEGGDVDGEDPEGGERTPVLLGNAPVPTPTAPLEKVEVSQSEVSKSKSRPGLESESRYEVDEEKSRTQVQPLPQPQPQPENKAEDQSQSSTDIINCPDFGIEDLLSPEELEAEMAES